MHPLQREKQTGGVDNGDELKAQVGILCLCMTENKTKDKIHSYLHFMFMEDIE